MAEGGLGAAKRPTAGEAAGVVHPEPLVASHRALVSLTPLEPAPARRARTLPHLIYHVFAKLLLLGRWRVHVVLFVNVLYYLCKIYINSLFILHKKENKLTKDLVQVCCINKNLFEAKILLLKELTTSKKIVNSHYIHYF